MLACVIQIELNFPGKPWHPGKFSACILSSIFASLRSAILLLLFIQIEGIKTRNFSLNKYLYCECILCSALRRNNKTDLAAYTEKNVVDSPPTMRKLGFCSKFLLSTKQKVLYTFSIGYKDEDCRWLGSNAYEKRILLIIWTIMPLCLRLFSETLNKRCLPICGLCF